MVDTAHYLIRRRIRLANILNLERNLKFEICLEENDMFDYRPERCDYENWIPFTLHLNLPNRCSMIDESTKATMTVFEIKKLIKGIENVLIHLENQKNCIYSFNCSESFFDLKLETILEDNVIEIELWINVGNQTNGMIHGYDDGVRFVTGIDELNKFLRDFKKEFYELICS